MLNPNTSNHISARPLLEDVFTPASIARRTYVRRTYLEKQLKKGMQLPGVPVLVNGPKGSGKSSLLRFVIGAGAIEPIIIHCTWKTTFDDIKISTFDKLDPFTPPVVPQRKKSVIIRGLSRLLETIFRRRRPLPTCNGYGDEVDFQLTGEKMVNCLAARNKILVIENFHLLTEEVKLQVNELVRTFTFVAGAAEMPARLLLCGTCAPAELEGLLTEIWVPPLDKAQLISIICKGEKLLNIRFSERLRQFLLQCSDSNAGGCQRVCYNFCRMHGVLCRRNKKIYFKNSLSFQNR